MIYLKNKTGITLIALVITIVVLLILAGVSISMLTGSNSIIKQAQNAEKETEQAQIEENTTLLDYENYINEHTTGGYVESKGVNAPQLGKNMELVTYDETSKTWKTNNSSSSYDYIAGDGNNDNNKSKWANAKVTIDGIDSYFVWIPRYAYKITYNDVNNKSSGGTISIKFLIGTTDNYYDEEGNLKTAKRATTGQEDTSQDYYVHPVFTNNIDLGGWDKELTGIWVGKYETSLVNKTDIGNYIETSSNKEGNILLSEPEQSQKAMRVQANKSSWRFCSIGKMYTNAKLYSPDLNSHMLKNSEWGTVVYLTYSEYGRNGNIVTINDNNNFLTADGDIEENVNQSSTGNVYGIYDLSGGASEYVSAYYVQYTNEPFKQYGADLINEDEKNSKLLTKYTGTDVSLSYKIGDATFETNNWNGDYGAFLKELAPTFNRGGTYNSINNEGIFLYSCNDGSINYSNISMRLSLVI